MCHTQHAGPTGTDGVIGGLRHCALCKELIPWVCLAGNVKEGMLLVERGLVSGNPLYMSPGQYLCNISLPLALASKPPIQGLGYATQAGCILCGSCLHVHAAGKSLDADASVQHRSAVGVV